MTTLDLFSVFEEKTPTLSSSKTTSTDSIEEKTIPEVSISSITADGVGSSSRKRKELSSEENRSGMEPQIERKRQQLEDELERTLQHDQEKRAFSNIPMTTTNNLIISDTEPIACLHELCLPPKEDNIPFDAKWTQEPTFPVEPVRTWSFTLDPFQRMSIACLEMGHSVLVSAHTSAGKTVVAEYAIAMSLKAKQRVIYTSPIKALSNQKYRELSEIFSDVGLMTGDITISPSASCLVMTTEILRSMLYRGSEVMREVAWVIFDEIHYMRDRERGVVWEETIILLPDQVKFVFLSATIPNAKEFALWVANIHRQPCHVVYTDVRPTPLQHYIFPAGGDGLHLVVDEKGNFREDNFQKALAQLIPKTETRGKPGKKGKGAGGSGSDCYKIVKMIMERNYQPVIVFSFSKKECEALALQMSKIDLTDEKEKMLIEKIFSNAIDNLSDDDKNLPQVNHILPLLKRGVGIHHSGLLPILKEVIEIIFQEGLIKALFATETFSMGLNMPAKTVVFTSVRKFDGDNFRWISSGEYIQMSGRAGRRGLDDRGIVILMVDEKMEPSIAKNMVKGSADPLNSSFHIGYNMLLNLLRVEGIDPEYMLKRSFHQYQTDHSRPELQTTIAKLERERNAISIRNEEMVSEYYQLREQWSKHKEAIREIINRPIHVLPYLQPGRLVKVREGDVNWGWGVVVNFQKKLEKGHASNTTDNISAKYIVDVLLNCAQESDVGVTKPKPCPSGESGVVQVIPVALPLLNGLSTIRVYIPKDLRPLESRQSVGRSIREVIKRFPDGIPYLDPIEDMKIEDSNLKKLIRKLETVENELHTNEAFQEADIGLRYEQFCRKILLENEIKILKKTLKQGENVILRYELKCMKRVLRRLEYTNSEDIIETKGKVACEINAADELVVSCPFLSFPILMMISFCSLNVACLW